MTTGPLDHFLSPKPSASSEETAAQPAEHNGITKPETEIDANHGGRLEETRSKRSLQMDRDSDSAPLRNDGYGKYTLKETMVSSNVSTEPKALPANSNSISRHSRLRMKDEWHSDDASVQKMLDYLRLQKSGSLQSARSHLEILDRLCRGVGMIPSKLVSLKRRDIESLVRQHCDKVIERSRLRGPSANYANTTTACLKTFFASNGFNKENNRVLRLKNYHQPPRTTNRPEYIPSLKQALSMSERCGNKRDRAIVLTLMTTGLRNTALRALKVGDVLDQLREGKKILLIKVEASWNARIPGACKNNIPYSTFTAKIATEAIDSMLKEREVKFGSYSSDEPLFISNYNQINPGARRMKPLTARTLNIVITKAAQAADIPECRNVHVHTLRKVFEAVLRAPLADGGAMDPKDQEFLMGHLLPGSQDHYYDRTKVENMRELYSKLVFEDRSTAQALSLETTRKLAKILGVDLSRVKAIREKEVGRQLSNQEEEELLEQEIGLAYKRQNQEEQKIAKIEELEQYIESGWSLVTELSDGRVVVRRKPSTAS